MEFLLHSAKDQTPSERVVACHVNCAWFGNSPVSWFVDIHDPPKIGLVDEKSGGGREAWVCVLLHATCTAYGDIHAIADR